MTPTQPQTESMRAPDANRAALEIEILTSFGKHTTLELVAIIQREIQAAYAQGQREGREQAAEWWPIETAPKDGIEILVAYGHQNFVMELVYWDRLHGYWFNKGRPRLGLENNATHWIRLSKPSRSLSDG